MISGRRNQFGGSQPAIPSCVPSTSPGRYFNARQTCINLSSWYTITVGAVLLLYHVLSLAQATNRMDSQRLHSCLREDAARYCNRVSDSIPDIPVWSVRVASYPHSEDYFEYSSLWKLGFLGAVWVGGAGQQQTAPYSHIKWSRTANIIYFFNTIIEYRHQSEKAGNTQKTKRHPEGTNTPQQEEERTIGSHKQLFIS